MYTHSLSWCISDICFLLFFLISDPVYWIQSTSPDPVLRGTHHGHPFLGGGGGGGRNPVGGLCTRLCVCVTISCEIRKPNKSGINLPTIFVLRGKEKPTGE